MENNESSNMFGAFVWGAMLGGIFALLFAPEKGQVTRMRLQRNAKEWAQRGERAFEKTRDVTREKGQGYAQTIRHKAQTLGEQAKHQVDAVKEAAREASETYKRELRNTSVEPSSSPLLEENA